MIWEISPLLKYEILGVIVNTLTDNENYPFWGFWIFAVPYSNAIIWKMQKIFSLFCSIHEIFIKF